MRTLSDVKTELLQALGAVVDEPLKHVGFARSKGSLTYSRMLNAALQQINFVADYFPKYHPGAEVHIHPMLMLKLPEVSEKALELVQGESFLLAGAPDVILNQPIEFTIPKDKHQRWFATGETEFTATCTLICASLATWVFPFLSEVTTPGELIRTYEAVDTRVLKQRHWYIFVAAAYEILAKREEARRVVQEQFGSLGLKKRYRPLFESLGIE